MGRRVFLPVVVLCILCLLIVVGRWEGGQQARHEEHGIADVWAAVSSIVSPTLSGFRWSPTLQCLDYRRNERPYALEICVDRSGRIVQASDRRTDDLRFYSLRFDRDAATVVAPETSITAAVRRLQRTTERSIWSVVVADVETCLRHAAVTGSIRLARLGVADASAACIEALDSVGISAHAARDVGLVALQQAAESLDLVLADYRSALTALAQSLQGPAATTRRGLATYDLTTARLRTRIADIAQELGRKRPALDRQPRLSYPP